MTTTPKKLTKPVYSVTKEDWTKAAAEYGECNCGPSALAIMIGMTACDTMPHIPHYKERHYTSPSMMKAALASLKVPWKPYKALKPNPHALTNNGLVRIQWEGPWTDPGSNPKWAYRQTHWVGAMLWNNERWVFDVNSGWTSEAVWLEKTVPLLIQHTPRATGGWYSTDLWELWP